MRCEQSRFSPSVGWRQPAPPGLGRTANLALVFGSADLLADTTCLGEIERAYPSATIVGCSTAGEISDVEVTSETLTVTAISFSRATVRSATSALSSPGDSYDVGRRLGRQLERDDLRHVVVLSEGLNVNGSALAEGIDSSVQPSAHVTGGLAGDGERFGRTSVLADGVAGPDRVVAVGLFGSGLQTGFGSVGGWDPFGPERLITRSEGSVLFELDGRSALEIYRRYLGPYERQLPASALLFPLAVRRDESTPAIVRTVLAIDDDAQSMTFAGDMPEGAYARFMKANYDRLVAGAAGAASQGRATLGRENPELALLVSCVGRRMVLKQRIEEEVEAVRSVLGPDAVLTGFYSYGEISPVTPEGGCCLHNQTMTVTTLHEDRTA